ncbi:MAG: MotA/TolQ/ExbB proton channel family protein [Pirellulales bacterium]
MPKASMDLSNLSAVSQFAGDLCYLFLAAVALWGLYCVVVVWRRINQLRFRNEAEQSEFMTGLETYLAANDYVTAAQFCEGDERVVPQLAGTALEHKDIDPGKLRHMLADRYQRDVSADLEYRQSWINTVIKTAPMLGLFGTVLGMMSAFGKLGSGDKVEAAGLAEDISLALITTAIGLAIAIPLSLAVASINIRIRKLEDVVNVGLSRILDSVGPQSGGSPRR